MLSLVAGARPSWFASESGSAVCLIGVAAPVGTVWASRPLRLTVRLDAVGVPIVAEVEPGAQLPRFCPESHLFANASFCLGLDRPPVVSALEAQQWWADLLVYLRLQSVAERTGVWPRASGLDHGAAGPIHAQALRVADEAGLAEDYAAAIAGEMSWITDQRLRIVDDGGRPLNGRAPCPRRCRGKRGDPTLRRKCPKRHQITELTLLERRRRRETDLFWRSVRQTGQSCCGRMRDCPLLAHTVNNEGQADEGTI